MTNHAKLAAALRQLQPNIRFDTDLRERTLAMMVLTAKGLRSDERTTGGRRLRDESDEYVVARALDEIADVRIDDRSLTDVFKDGARKRARQNRDLARQPLPNAKERSK